MATENWVRRLERERGRKRIKLDKVNKKKKIPKKVSFSELKKTADSILELHDTGHPAKERKEIIKMINQIKNLEG